MQLVSRYQALAPCSRAILAAVECIAGCFHAGNKLLICGNGGSAADCEHIVGELMKAFLMQRKLPKQFEKRLFSVIPSDAEYLKKNLEGALPAISLASHTSLMTAFANDKAPDLVFAQQIVGYGRAGDVLLAISTSGNSKNVLYAAQTARAAEMKIIALTGISGGKLKDLSDIIICAPSSETFMIQEYHLPIYHCICASLENEFFGEKD